jgi:signal transduction histidine kinase
MKNTSLDFSRVLHTAAWGWLSYLFLLACIDSYIYTGHPFMILLPYYLINGGIALLFLGCSYWAWLQNSLKEYYVPLMLLIIAGLPIIANRLWIPPLPPGPMANIEGLTLRLLPVLFIGLVITAWHYSLAVVVLFALGTTGLEIALVRLNPPAGTNAPHAILFITLVRSASFLVVGYFVNRLVAQLKTQQTELEQANTRLVHYASTVEQLSISRERNRLARELHDTLAHTLSALSVQLETAKAYWNVDAETARVLLVKSLQATRSGLDETRRALKALRASPIEDLGLLLGLQKLAQSAAERGRLTLALSLPDQVPSLSPDVEQCIYRIAQESIENVVHHANAKELKVRLETLDAEINLYIEDDGLGFDLNQNPEVGHYGLAGMRERAQLVGAGLEIHSRPNQGTRIQLKIKGI